MKKRNSNLKLVKMITAMCLIGSISVAAGCGSKDTSPANNEKTDEEKTDEEITIRLGVMTNYADQYLAVVGNSKGFFEKNGIKLEITEYAAGINTVDAITTEQADIGFLADYAAVNRIGNSQEDTNLRIIANFSTGVDSKLYVNPDKVASLEELAGQGVITLPGTVWDYWNAKMLDEGNVDQADRVILNVDSAQDALSVMVSGQGVAFWANGTSATKMEEAGMKPIVTMEELGLEVDLYYLSSTNFIENHPEAVENFLKAVKETEEWLVDNKEEAAQILEDEINIPKEQSLDNFETIVYSVSLTQRTLDHFNEVKEWAVREGRFDKDYNALDFFDTTIIKELYPEDVEF